MLRNYRSTVNLRPALWTALAAAAIGLSEPVLGPLEDIAYDFRLSLRWDAGWPAYLVGIPIDDAAMRTHGRWPWAREKQAELLRAIGDAGASVVVYDFVTGTPTNAASDADFASSLSRSVLAISASDGGGDPTIDPKIRAAFVAVEPWRRMRPDQLIAPMPAFSNGARGVGHILMHYKRGRMVRGHTPFFGVEGEKGSLPSLSLTGFLLHHGHDARSLRTDARGNLLLPTGRRIALNQGEMLLDLVRGGPGPVKVTASEILSNPKSKTTRAALNGKLALVYIDSASEQDTLPSPLDPTTPGGLLQMYAIRTLDNGRTPADFSPRLFLALLSIAMIAAAGPLARRPPNHVLGIHAALAAVLAIATVVLVPLFDVFLPVAGPIFFLLAAGGLGSAHASRVSERERRRLQGLLKASLADSTFARSSDDSIPTRADRPDATVVPDPQPSHAARGSQTNEQRFPEPGKELAEPVVVGRYLIQRQVGRGGMGAIFLAKDQDLDRLVAIKVLEAAEKGEYTRFRREAMAVAKISHPNVVQIYEIGFNAASPYIAMEYVSGGTVSDVLRDPDQPFPMPWERSARIIAGVARGLGAAHAQDIVHRDVKPSNLLLVERLGTIAKVADFGIAKLAGSESITREGSFVGTIGYLSPEQATGGATDARSDVYSLGITWFRMVTGRPAFEGSTAQILRASVLHEIRDPRLLASTIPDPIAELMKRMCSVERTGRPRDGNAVADEIDAILAANAPAVARSI